MQPLVEKHRPRKLSDFAGLKPIRSMFERFAAAPYSSAWLLTGQAGTGKTTLAYAVAELIGGQLYHVASRSCDLAEVNHVADLCSGTSLFSKTAWWIVVVDEADLMTKGAQEAFLSLLDSTEAPKDTVFIFTSNDTAKLEKRFLSRCRVLEFDLAPDAAEAVQFLTKVWKAETTAEVPDLDALFTACSSNLRDCLMKLEIKIAMHPPAEVQPVKRGKWVTDWRGRTVWMLA
jgi:DNA polymerase III gamma/tau subunit